MNEPWINVEIPPLELGPRPELGDLFKITGKLRVVEVTDRVGARTAVTVRLEHMEVEKE
jgi:hypothetical protein